jgi:hypothetical protein
MVRLVFLVVIVDVRCQEPMSGSGWVFGSLGRVLQVVLIFDLRHLGDLLFAGIADLHDVGSGWATRRRATSGLAAEPATHADGDAVAWYPGARRGRDEWG